MTSDRGMDLRNTAHIPIIFDYMRNNAYINELGAFKIGKVR